VSHEIEYALGAKHLRGRLIPVMIRPTKGAPWILDSLQQVRYQNPGKTGRQIVKLLVRPETELSSGMTKLAGIETCIFEGILMKHASRS
jgi:hypothetical protein